jgi:hypothetical protein
MTPDEIRTYFSTPNQGYFFARWNRPIVPVVFGDHCLEPDLLKAALGRLGELTGQPVDLAAPASSMNYGTLVVRDWRDLTDMPGVPRLMPNLAKLAAQLEAEGANQYRVFQRDWRGGIKRCFAAIRTGTGRFADLTPESMALRQVTLSFLQWSIPGIVKVGLVGPGPDGRDDLKPQTAALLKAAYDPALPTSSKDPRHAEALAARMAG